MFDTKRFEEVTPIQWGIMAAVVAVLLWMGFSYILVAFWTVVGYAFWFGLLGIGLFMLDSKGPKLLARHLNRLIAAFAIALIWAGFRSTGLVSLTVHLFFAVWSFMVLLVAFSLGKAIWKNRDAISQRFDDVAHNRVSPVDALREAAGATKTAVADGVADGVSDFHKGRKATTG